MHILPPSTTNRVLDSRKFSKQPLAGNTDHTVDVGDLIPAGAQAIAVNLVAVGPTSDGFLAAWSHGRWPGTASITFDGASSAVSNECTVLLEPGTKKFRVRSSSPVHVVADVVGYYV